jgi:16S rRNA (cytosine967-C5)-methyltransferase
MLRGVEKGAFASEVLRRIWRDVEPAERKLAATLSYAVLRKLGLWRHLLSRCCKRPAESLNPATVSILLTGIAGVMDLEHFKPGVLVNALVQKAKNVGDEGGGSREGALVNAVLRTVMREAPAYVESLSKSTALRDQALAAGVPGWAAAEWNADYGMTTAKRLVRLSDTRAFLSLRLHQHTDRAEWIERYKAETSEDTNSSAGDEPDFTGRFSFSVHLHSNPYPPDLPGYESGEITPEGESSIWAVETLLPHIRGDRVLDMCMGRGVKAGQILSRLPDVSVEGWDLSQARLKAARREFDRLGVGGRVTVTRGDSRELVPMCPPSAILLDAPCSGSGTWRRHPEAKWRMTPSKLREAAAVQEALFSRAADLLTPGGIMMYCTCSTFRAENEKVAGAVLSRRADLTEIPVRGAKTLPIQRGKPYGMFMYPEDPWIDGFYVAIFKKKG